MKNSLLKTSIIAFSIFVSATFALHAQLINVQFGGNDFNGGNPLATPQTGAGFIGTAGDQWNNFTNTFNLTLGVSLNTSSGASSGATLTVSSTGTIYQYAVGAAGTSSNGADGSKANQLGGTAVGNLAQAELGTYGGGPDLALTFTGLAANAPFTLYILTAADRWERPSTWSVNGGASQNAAALNTYTGPNSASPGNGYNPYTLEYGYNYLTFTGTTTGAGGVVLNGTGPGEFDINGLQLQVTSVPEASTVIFLALGTIAMIAVVRRKTA